MSLYPNVARFSTLVPGVWEPEWTVTDRVLSDQPPGVAGVGAVQLAAQALNLSIAQAAHLVATQSEATGLNASTLTKAANAAAMAGFGSAKMQGSYAGRLPIPPSVATAVALLGGDPGRVSLMVQNNNAAGGANLLVSVDGAIDTGSPWGYMNLVPGQGILIDQNAWTNPIYVAWATGAVLGGVLMYGTNNAQLNNSGGIAVPTGGIGPVSFLGGVGTAF